MAELIGILNLTPDSHSDGGKYYDPDKALARAQEIFEEGATLLDVGAETTKPGAIPLDQRTEQWRLGRVLPELVQMYPGQISVDTYKPETARWVLDKFGKVVINDVTGMNSPEMVDVVTGAQAPCIVSHAHGTDIQAVHRSQLINTAEVVLLDLISKHALLVDRGLDPEAIILDPGLGFGKTARLNEELLETATLLRNYEKKLEVVEESPDDSDDEEPEQSRPLNDYSVAVSYSHKRFIGKYFTLPGEDRKDLEPNLRAGIIARASGADYLRVHDVAGHRQLT